MKAIVESKNFIITLKIAVSKVSSKCRLHHYDKEILQQGTLAERICINLRDFQ